MASLGTKTSSTPLLSIKDFAASAEIAFQKTFMAGVPLLSSGDVSREHDVVECIDLGLCDLEDVGEELVEFRGLLLLEKHNWAVRIHKLKNEECDEEDDCTPDASFSTESTIIDIPDA